MYRETIEIGSNAKIARDHLAKYIFKKERKGFVTVNNLTYVTLAGREHIDVEYGSCNISGTYYEFGNGDDDNRGKLEIVIKSENREQLNETSNEIRKVANPSSMEKLLSSIYQR